MTSRTEGRFRGGSVSFVCGARLSSSVRRCSAGYTAGVPRGMYTGVYTGCMHGTATLSLVFKPFTVLYLFLFLCFFMFYVTQFPCFIFLRAQSPSAAAIVAAVMSTQTSLRSV